VGTRSHVWTWWQLWRMPWLPKLATVSQPTLNENLPMLGLRNLAGIWSHAWTWWSGMACLSGIKSRVCWFGRSRGLPRDDEEVQLGRVPPALTLRPAPHLLLRLPVNNVGQQKFALLPYVLHTAETAHLSRGRYHTTLRERLESG
jgi:hypothetical protein